MQQNETEKDKTDARKLWPPRPTVSAVQTGQQKKIDRVDQRERLYTDQPMTARKFMPMKPSLIYPAVD
jgi:hypothetical protein